jgi:hypothetical protein
MQIAAVFQAIPLMIGNGKENGEGRGKGLELK